MIKASELLLQSAEPFDKACMMVRAMEQELRQLKYGNEVLKKKLINALDKEFEFCAHVDKQRRLTVINKVFSDE